MSDILNQSYNPLLEINTSFESYLNARTRSYTDHVVGGRMDYAFDGDFAMRSKINTISGWSKLYKTITTADMPNRFKRLFQSTDLATSMLHANAYNAAQICSERMQLNIPTVMVKKAKDVPEIYSLTGDGIEPSIVITADIEDICTKQELCFLIGCELGRMQNKHSAFNYAFTYPGITLGNTVSDKFAEYTGNDRNAMPGNYRQLSYALNSWLAAADLTADRAGIICLDDPAEFADIFVSIRKKGIPDSFGNVECDINVNEIKEKFEVLHTTPVRSLSLAPDVSQDERRLYAGLEFTGCEVLYHWRPELAKSGQHLTNKQALEIRCEILAGADRQSV